MPQGEPSRRRARGFCERQEGEPWSCSSPWRLHQLTLVKDVQQCVEQGITGLLQLVDQHQVELQIGGLPLVQLLLGEVLLGVLGRLVAVADVSGSGSDQLVDLVGVLELGAARLSW